jgi:hypothetical protein
MSTHSRESRPGGDKHLMWCNLACRSTVSVPLRSTENAWRYGLYCAARLRQLLRSRAGEGRCRYDAAYPGRAAADGGEGVQTAPKERYWICYTRTRVSHPRTHYRSVEAASPRRAFEAALACLRADRIVNDHEDGAWPPSRFHELYVTPAYARHYERERCFGWDAAGDLPR